MTQPAPLVHIMADIETFSPKPGGLIVSIGAVKFTATKILQRFEVGIDPEDAQRFGLTIDASTVMWWLDPKRDEARRKLIELPKVDLYSALAGFADWVRQDPEDQRGSLWGKGATFDNVLLNGAYAAAGQEYPFSYRQDECYRTLANRCPDVEYKQIGTAHVGVDDAESQAVHLQQICAQYGIAL